MVEWLKVMEQKEQEGLYPLHMPGHKRRLRLSSELPYDWDWTEVEGLDDLHEPSEWIQELETSVARSTHAAQSYLLVNGSTGGILSALYAVLPRKAEILMMRASHRSVYHAAELLDLQLHFFPIRFLEGWPVAAPVTLEELQQAHQAHPQIKLVLLTSPSYEGIITNLREIASYCRQHQIYLMVDAAHGAHQRFCPWLPESALYAGADLVVESWHKTLPALTSTAFLHRSSRVEDAALRHALRIFQTSSPSYPLMASLDFCQNYLLQQGKSAYEKMAEQWAEFYERLQSCRILRIFGCEQMKKQSKDMHSFFMEGAELIWDPGKLLISAKLPKWNGKRLQTYLRDQGFACEMSCGPYVLGILTLADSQEMLHKLAQVLIELDQHLQETAYEQNTRLNLKGDFSSIITSTGQETQSFVAAFAQKLPQRRCGLDELQNYAKKKMLVPSLKIDAEVRKEAEKQGQLLRTGCVAAESIWVYPPGIPLLLAGEIIDEDLLKQIQNLEALDTVLHNESRYWPWIQVVDEAPSVQ